MKKRNFSLLFVSPNKNGGIEIFMRRIGVFLLTLVLFIGVSPYQTLAAESPVSTAIEGEILELTITGIDTTDKSQMVSISIIRSAALDNPEIDDIVYANTVYANGQDTLELKINIGDIDSYSYHLNVHDKTGKINYSQPLVDDQTPEQGTENEGTAGTDQSKDDAEETETTETSEDNTTDVDDATEKSEDKVTDTDNAAGTETSEDNTTGADDTTEKSDDKVTGTDKSTDTDKSENKITGTVNPSTGDNNNIYAGLAVMLVSGMIILAIVLYRRTRTKT